MDTTKIRTQYPQYKNVSDGALLYGFYKTTPKYQEMPMGEYADKLGMTSTQFKEMIAAAKESGVTPTTSSTTESGPGNEVITGFNQQDQTLVNPDMESMGMKEGLLSNAAQGVTLGGSDEIFGHMYAIKEVLGGSELSYDDLYSRMKNFEEKRIADFRRTDPKKAFASEITGAIATSVAVSPVLALLKSPKFIKDLSKGTKAFLQSGGAGAIYGANTGEEGDRGMNALKVGGLSAFGGFVLNKIGGIVSNKYNKLRNKVDESPSIENIQQLKNDAYKTAKDLDIKFSGDLVETIKKEGIDSFDESFDPLLNKHAASAKNLYEKILDKAYLEGISFEKLDLLQRQLWSKLKESGNQEVKIYPLINAVNKLIQSHPDTSTASIAAKNANKLYNKAKTFDWEFTKVNTNKDVTGNIGQKYKMSIRNILNNKKLRSQFDENDIEHMEAFLKGNITDSMLKGFGKLSPTSGALPSFLAISGMVATGGNIPLAIAIAASVAAKGSFNKRTSQSAEKLLNYIKQYKPDTSINSALPGASTGTETIAGQGLEQLQEFSRR